MSSDLEETSEMISAIHEENVKTVSDLIDVTPLWEERCGGIAGHNLLCHAIESKRSKIARLLMIKGAKVNSESENPKKTPLHFAVINRDIEIIKTLIDKGAHLNVKDESGFTALHYATKTGMQDIAMLLLHHGATVDATDNNNQTPLEHAIGNGSIDIVKELLQYGADINAKSSHGSTMLHIAIANGYTDITKLLLTKGVNINIEDENCESPLCLAIQKKHTEVAKDLLERGASVHSISTSYKGYTLLHMACENGLTEIVELLLRNGAKDAAEAKLFRAAIEKGCVGIVESFLKYGVKLDDRSELLDVAVKSRSEEMIRLFLEHGFDANNIEVDGNSLLHCIALSNEPLSSEDDNDDVNLCTKADLAEFLLRTGADVNAKNKDGLTALHLAIKAGNTDIVQILLEHGADFNLIALGKSPLHMAVDNKVEEICRLLVERGPDLHVKDETGCTALHVASNCGLGHILETLLTCGVDIDSLFENHTTLHLIIHDVMMCLLKISQQFVQKQRIDVQSGLILPRTSPCSFKNCAECDPFIADDGTHITAMFNVMDRYIRKIQCIQWNRNKGKPMSISINIPVSQPSACTDIYKEEMKRMKKMKIDKTNVTFADILIKRMNEVILYVRNEDIVRALMLNNYKKEVPHFAVMIESRFKRAMIREKLLSVGGRIFFNHFSRPYTLPYECSDVVLNYLNNADLTALKNACKSIRSNIKDVTKQGT